MTDLTDDQKRVLQALAEIAAEINPHDPTAVGISEDMVAERLGMTVEEVPTHVQALDHLGYLIHGEIIDVFGRDDDLDDPDWDEDLTFDERRVYKAYLMAQETDRPHRSHAEVARQLGMTVEEVAVIAEGLTERGFLNSTWDRLTEDQQRVLMAMPVWEPDMKPVPTTAQLAEQLEMSVEDVRECLRVLREGHWLWDVDPHSVLDALMLWGWHTPADELAQRLHMDIAEVDQRLLELAELGYDVRLI